jgi:4-diphosphocytidyl-2-C-methyl-D-erythritol kinase
MTPTPPPNTPTEHTELAPAKLNLGLKVLGERADGFHEICSVMQTVDLVDRLSFQRHPVLSMSCTDPTLSTGPGNLVMRAGRLFEERARALGFPCDPFHIHLEKQIPMGAGLGGGSADCAAVLRGLNLLSGSPFDDSALHDLGAELGSDVPFLLKGGTALVRGRGEIVDPLEWRGPDFYYVLVSPEVEISTAWAYGQLQSALTVPSSYLNLVGSISGGHVDSTKLLEVLENDFQSGVGRANPIVAQAVDQIRQTGPRACSMSGTGSTAYGVYDDRNVASGAAAQIQANGFRSFFCRPFFVGLGK